MLRISHTATLAPISSAARVNSESAQRPEMLSSAMSATAASIATSSALASPPTDCNSAAELG